MWHSDWLCLKKQINKRPHRFVHYIENYVLCKKCFMSFKTKSKSENESGFADSCRVFSETV